MYSAKVLKYTNEKIEKKFSKWTSLCLMLEMGFGLHSHLAAFSIFTQGYRNLQAINMVLEETMDNCSS